MSSPKHERYNRLIEAEFQSYEKFMNIYMAYSGSSMQEAINFR